MISGSKQPPASERNRSQRTWLMLLLPLLMMLSGTVVQAAKDSSAGTVLVLAFPADSHPSARESEWLQQDRRWYISLPPAGKVALPDLPDSAAWSPDPRELARLRAVVAAAAASSGDSMPVVRSVASRLRDRWLDRGYLSARLTVTGDTLRIDPGPVWTVGVFDVAGDDFPGREHLLGTWLPREGDRFEREDWSRGIDMVLAGAGEAGYPFPRWVTREVGLVAENHTVTIRAMLLPGNRAFFGPISSDLKDERAARFLAKTSGIRSGSLFEQSELARARERLLSRDLYTTVGEPRVYLTSASDTVGVHFPVVARRKVNHLQVVLGLSRREDGSGSRLSGAVDLRLPNMAGTGRKLQVGWQDDGNTLSRFGFSYLEPLAFGTPLDMYVALDNEIQRDVYTRFRLDNIWSLPVVALWGVELGVGWDRSTYPTGYLERTSRVRGRGAVSHRRGDRSRSGWEGVFAIETARRSSVPRTEMDVVIPSSAQLAEVVIQQIYEVDTAGELWLGRTLSLAGRASFRQLDGGDPIVPLSEQFRFGGATTLRGYQEDVFHGTRAAWGGLELRIGRPGASRLYTFYDLGYFEFWTLDALAPDPAALLQIRGWPKGYGLGLLARTPAGDISLAIGFPGTVDFDRAKLHVTLLENF